MQFTKQLSPDYELVDSGGGAKLERFGGRLLIRPSTLCIWKRRESESVWNAADAEYDHDAGWKTNRKGPETWEYRVADELKLKLRYQNNGQLGVFPEHDLYLTAVSKWVTEVKAQRQKAAVLNLFAYTGMATIVSAAAGAEVTHLDLSKSAIGWAKENLECSGLGTAPVRFIAEDALAFLRREVRRGSRYDLVIADPPSFSRISKTQSWSLEETLPELVSLVTEVTEVERGRIVLTAHAFESGAETLSNLLIDALEGRNITLSSGVLALEESHSQRRIPASCYVVTGS